VHVDENLAETTIGIISCSEVDLLTANARLLGLAVAPVGEAAKAASAGPRLDSAVVTQAASDVT
jgi:hypothetical protein